jgi:hypothetical protein
VLCACGMEVDVEGPEDWLSEDVRAILQEEGVGEADPRAVRMLTEVLLLMVLLSWRFSGSGAHKCGLCSFLLVVAAAAVDQLSRHYHVLLALPL